MLLVEISPMDAHPLAGTATLIARSRAPDPCKTLTWLAWPGATGATRSWGLPGRLAAQLGLGKWQVGRKLTELKHASQPPT